MQMLMLPWRSWLYISGIRIVPPSFVPDKNIMMPNDGTAEEGLRLLINKKLF